MNDRQREIAQALSEVERRIDQAADRAGRSREEITLIVVTKNYPASDVVILRELGIKNFGENRENEGRAKSALVSGVWHFQGQIQSNKIAAISRWADVIHSIDKASHIEKLAAAIPPNKPLSAFLQVSLDIQPGRGGVRESELAGLAQLVLEHPQIHLIGLMAVAPLGQPPELAFKELQRIHIDFQCKFPTATALSAGMSGDFESAIQHGATHLRIGSSILGLRSLKR